MYLAGLIQPRARPLGALSETGVPPSVCMARGGIPRLHAYQQYDANRNGVPGTEIWACDFPASLAAKEDAPGAIISVSVPTQVSPQISPAFVQQDEPRDSPVTATPVSVPTASPAFAVDYNAGAVQAAQLREQQARDEAARVSEENAALRKAAGEGQYAPTVQGPGGYGAAPMYVTASGGAASPVPGVDTPAVSAPLSFVDRLSPWAPIALAGVAVLTYLANRRKKRRR